MIKEAERHRSGYGQGEKQAEQHGPIDIVIETPKGSHAKYKFDLERKVFKFDKILPAGLVFPYSFGFIPETKAEDGDPLDVLMLSDIVGFPGCVIPSKLLGVLEAEQTEQDGSAVRNDRIIAVAKADPLYDHTHSLFEVNRTLLDEIAHFFTSYNEMRGVKFKLLGMRPADVAYALIKKSLENERGDRPKRGKAA